MIFVELILAFLAGALVCYVLDYVFTKPKPVHCIPERRERKDARRTRDRRAVYGDGRRMSYLVDRRTD